MDISAGLIAKGTAGALAASAAVGGGIMTNKQGLLGDWFNANVERSELASEVEEQESVNSLQEPPETARTNRSNPSGINTETVTTPGNGETQGGPAATGNQDAADLPQNNENGDSREGSITTDGSVGDNVGSIVNQAQDSKVKGSKKKQEKNLTEWDESLVNFLRGDGASNRDIVFGVKTGKSPNDVDLTTAFPSFEQDTNKKKLTITVTASTGSNLQGSDLTDKITELKKKNGNSDWTWECIITLSKANKEDEISLESKEKLIGSEGFFNKLAGSGEKDLKAKFIENCAGARGGRKTVTTLTDGKISAEKDFVLEKVSDGGTNWKIKDDDYKAWFLTATAQ